MHWAKRFSSKVMVRAQDECWSWTALILPNGYGQYWFEGRMHMAHRMALVLLGKKIPPNAVVMHSCDNRICCNPAHLTISSQADNMHDMIRKNRSARGEKHGCAILAECDVKNILKCKENATKTAEQYGVSKAAIYDIRQGRSWRHIKRQ